jgi:plastocyanin
MFGMTHVKVSKTVLVDALNEYFAKRLVPAAGEKIAKVTAVSCERWSDTVEIEFEVAETSVAPGDTVVKL